MKKNVRESARNKLQEISSGKGWKPIAATVYVGQKIEEVLKQSLQQTDEKLNMLRDLEQSVRAFDKLLFTNNRYSTAELHASLAEKFLHYSEIDNIISHIQKLLERISSLEDSHSLPLILPNLDRTQATLAEFPQNFQILKDEYAIYQQQEKEIYGPIDEKIQRFEQAVQQKKEVIEKIANKREKYKLTIDEDWILSWNQSSSDFPRVERKHKSYQQMSKELEKAQGKFNADKKGLSALRKKRALLSHPGDEQMLRLSQRYSSDIKNHFGSSISLPIDPSSFTKLGESRHFINVQLQATSQLTETLSQEIKQGKYSSYRSYEQLQSILISQTLQTGK
ncbi:hypothetical protein [Neochlamydia sp. S13]|uniref:hypothetical protein n=1 Tax=Neochlamydia sp. S13 TaxID=1353976 RepID=UPI0005A74B53|nr:hypothetical protein [Neochlamydia sp. S13]